jgi:hypothetical protein
MEGLYVFIISRPIQTPLIAFLKTTKLRTEDHFTFTRIQAIVIHQTVYLKIIRQKLVEGQSISKNSQPTQTPLIAFLKTITLRGGEDHFTLTRIQAILIHQTVHSKIIQQIYLAEQYIY